MRINFALFSNIIITLKQNYELGICLSLHTKPKGLKNICSLPSVVNAQIHDDTPLCHVKSPET